MVRFHCDGNSSDTSLTIWSLLYQEKIIRIVTESRTVPLEEYRAISRDCLVGNSSEKSVDDSSSQGIYCRKGLLQYLAGPFPWSLRNMFIVSKIIHPY